MHHATKPLRKALFPAAVLTAGLFTLFVCTVLAPTTLLAQSPPCKPCAGVLVADPAAAVAALAVEPRLADEERLYVAWAGALDGTADPAVFGQVFAQGGTPWMIVQFHAAAPLLDHLETLETELKNLARLAAGASERAHFQIDWQPAGGEKTPQDLGFLIKRAAVAVTGSRPDARVLVGPLPLDEDWFRQLYAEDVAAYLDGIALPQGLYPAQKAVMDAFTELDPGKGVVLDSLSFPDPASRTLAQAANATELGFDVVLFALDQPTAADLAPLKVLAQEFQGDLALDTSIVPTGVDRGWTFVHGEDLSLRVIFETKAGRPVQLYLEDPQLKRPETIDLETGERSAIFGQSRTSKALVVSLEDPGFVNLMRLERMSAEELAGMGGLDEEVTVEDERQMPVEEILRRLQAFEDGQARRLETYQAKQTMHMRYRVGTSFGAVETTFAGDFFFRQGQPYDWAWDEFYLNGVKWRRDKLPEIPLIEPEKSAILPLEITFTKEYRYRLRGTEDVDGREAWVIDFAPLERQEGEVLSQGTVWVDREMYARLKTRAVQVGLEGEVISNEETVFFNPVDESGQPAPFTPASYFLPTRSTGQQILSILNAPVLVEREPELTSIVINNERFENLREAKLESDATMVRDTQDGLRYLKKDEETGERLVEQNQDLSQKFVVAGVFYDAGLDFPIPLGGINYLSRDWRDTGLQVNAFIAGPLVIGNVANPRLFGSRWDAGVNVFGLLVPGEENVYRGGQEIEDEQIETGAGGRINLFLGRPLGDFWKLDFTYGLRWDSFSDTDKTREDFILPQDTLTQRFQTELTYQRNGYTVLFEGSLNQRSGWEFWGLPGNTDFDQEQEDYVLWRVSAGKTWWLPNFRKFGLRVDHVNGSDLDRFSQYDFDFFSDSKVAGYQDGLVTADEASGIHLLYGFELGEVFRVQLQGDAVWATNEMTGLEDELLAGVSFNGTVLGPWGTIVNFDLGVPVDGPAEDVVVFVTFLKLWN